MGFFLSVSNRKAVLAVFMFLLFSNLSASDREADAKNEDDGEIQESTEETATEMANDKNTDQVEELIEETTNENEMSKGGKQDMEEGIKEDYTEPNKGRKRDLIQAIKETAKMKNDTVDQEVNEETEADPDSVQEVTDETATENTETTTVTEVTDISQEINEYEDRIQELTEEEMEAVMKNCSLASLDDGRGSSRPSVPRFHCRVALWFQGKFPEWIKTFNFVKDVESLSEEELDKAAEAVCDCKIIDISDFCRAKVRETAQKIIDRCPRNTIITRLFKQTQSYFREDANLYYL